MSPVKLPTKKVKNLSISPVKKQHKVISTPKKKTLPMKSKSGTNNKNKNNNSSVGNVSVMMTDIKDAIPSVNEQGSVKVKNSPAKKNSPAQSAQDMAAYFNSLAYDMPLEERVKMRRAYMKDGNKTVPSFLGETSLPIHAPSRAPKSVVRVPNVALGKAGKGIKENVQSDASLCCETSVKSETSCETLVPCETSSVDCDLSVKPEPAMGESLVDMESESSEFPPELEAMQTVCVEAPLTNVHNNIDPSAKSQVSPGSALGSSAALGTQAMDVSMPGTVWEPSAVQPNVPSKTVNDSNVRCSVNNNVRIPQAPTLQLPTPIPTPQVPTALEVPAPRVPIPQVPAPRVPTPHVSTAGNVSHSPGRWLTTLNPPLPSAHMNFPLSTNTRVSPSAGDATPSVPVINTMVVPMQGKQPAEPSFMQIGNRIVQVVPTSVVPTQQNVSKNFCGVAGTDLQSLQTTGLVPQTSLQQAAPPQSLPCSTTPSPTTVPHSSKSPQIAHKVQLCSLTAAPTQPRVLTSCQRTPQMPLLVVTLAQPLVQQNINPPLNTSHRVQISSPSHQVLPRGVTILPQTSLQKGVPTLQPIKVMAATSTLQQTRLLGATSTCQQSSLPVGTSALQQVRHPVATSALQQVRHPVGTSALHQVRHPAGTSVLQQVRHPAGTSALQQVRHPVGTSTLQQVRHPVVASTLQQVRLPGTISTTQQANLSVTSVLQKVRIPGVTSALQPARLGGVSSALQQTSTVGATSIVQQCRTTGAVSALQQCRTTGAVSALQQFSPPQATSTLQQVRLPVATIQQPNLQGLTSTVQQARVTRPILSPQPASRAPDMAPIPQQSQLAVIHLQPTSGEMIQGHCMPHCFNMVRATTLPSREATCQTTQAIADQSTQPVLHQAKRTPQVITSIVPSPAITPVNIPREGTCTKSHPSRGPSVPTNSLDGVLKSQGK